jgi:hypothetical protein
MNKIEINIGLNNNPKTAERITHLLNLYFGGRELKNQVQIGEWEGADEPTLVLEVFSTHTQLVISELVEDLIVLCKQDAIPFRFNGVGELVFDEDYKGERYPFDEAYFLTIKG